MLYSSNMKAVILCAGEGTRLKPLTDIVPKPLLTVAGVPIVGYVLQVLPECVDEVALVIQKKHEVLFQNYLNTLVLPCTVSLVFQDEGTKGTYYALVAAQPFLQKEEPFLVLNGDDIFLLSELEKLCDIPAPAYGLALAVAGGRYRTCDVDMTTHTITSFRKQTPDEEGNPVRCFTGAYTLTQAFFSWEPVLVGDEAGIPHTLFGSGVSVSYTMFDKWIQINTKEELEAAQMSVCQ